MQLKKELWRPQIQAEASPSRVSEPVRLKILPRDCAQCSRFQLQLFSPVRRVMDASQPHRNTRRNAESVADICRPSIDPTCLRPESGEERDSVCSALII